MRVNPGLWGGVRNTAPATVPSSSMIEAKKGDWAPEGPGPPATSSAMGRIRLCSAAWLACQCIDQSSIIVYPKTR